MTLVEVTIAVAVIAFGALATLTTMVTTSQADEELRERSIALRAAISKMEEVIAFDYDDDIQALVTHWSQPANSTFTVEGIAPPKSPLAASPLPHGQVVVDGSDPLRIVVTISVSWSGRRGDRSLTLPMTLTEVLR